MRKLKNRLDTVFYKIFSSISILCRPVVVRRFFLTVSNVELVNYSANVAVTNDAVISPPMESDIPNEVLKRDLGNRTVFLDMNFSHRKNSPIGHKITNAFTYLENLIFIQIKTFKCISCVFQNSIKFFIIFFIFLLLVLLSLTLVFIVK